MSYLISELLVCLLIAAVLGLIVGWVLWGSIVRRLRHEALSNNLQLSKLNELPAKVLDLETKHSSLMAEKDAEASRFASRSNDFKQTVSAKEYELDQLRTSIFESDALNRTELARRDTHLAVLTARVAELEPLAGGSDAAAKCQDQIALRDTQIAALKQHVNELTIQHSAAMDAREEAKVPSATHVAEIEDLEARLNAALYDKQVLTSRVQELEPEVAKHVEAHTAKDLRIAQLEPTAARVPELEDQVADHLRVHSIKDYQIETLQGEISQLEPVAARVPDLEGNIAEHVKTHAAKDYHIELLQGKISELAPLAAMTPQLQEAAFLSSARIAELVPVAARVPELEGAIAEHVKAHAVKDSHIQSLHGKISELEPLAALTPQLQEAHALCTARIAELEPTAALVTVLESEVSHHLHAHARKDAHIEELKTELSAIKPFASQVPQLQSDLSTKDSEIAAHRAAHVTKDAYIRELSEQLATVETTALRVPELENTVSAKDNEKAGLLAEMDALSAHLRDLESHHAADLATKNADLQTLGSRLKQVEYDLSVSASHLRMLQEEESARIAEIVQLHKHVKTLTGELYQIRDQHSAATPPAKSMAAAVGFSSDASHPAAPVETSDPQEEARKQIIISARSAELNHLRRVLNMLFEPLKSDDIAQRAFKLSESRGFQGGSPQEDWLVAERQLHTERLSKAQASLEPQGLF